MNKIPTIVIYITVAMLFMGVAPLPYGYYMLLRIVACVFFVWAFFITQEQNHKITPWLFGLLAIVFNPIIKIHFQKEFWAIIDATAAIVILVNKSKLIEKNIEKNT